MLEAEAVRRGRDGYLEPVFYLGEKVATVKRYSDPLLMFLLKGNAPRKFSTKSQVEHSGPNGGPIRIKRTTERIEELIGDYLKRVQDS